MNGDMPKAQAGRVREVECVAFEITDNHSGGEDQVQKIMSAAKAGELVSHALALYLVCVENEVSAKLPHTQGQVRRSLEAALEDFKQGLDSSGLTAELAYFRRHKNDE